MKIVDGRTTVTPDYKHLQVDLEISRAVSRSHSQLYLAKENVFDFALHSKGFYFFIESVKLSDMMYLIISTMNIHKIKI